MKRQIDHYVKVLEPNKENVKKELDKAYGDNSYAFICDWIRINYPGLKMSTATLSRLKSGQAKLTEDLIEAIADFSQKNNKNAGVTVDSLARSNGMVLRDSAGGSREEVLSKRRDEVLNKEQRVCRIIRDELSDRGYRYIIQEGNIRKSFDERFANPANTVFARQYNMRLAISGVPGYTSWDFGLDTTVLDDDASEDEIKGAAMYALHRFANVLASDAYEFWEYDHKKYSFVFSDRRIYEAFLAKLDPLEFAGLMTAILVDAENSKVIEEEQLHCPEDLKLRSVFDEPYVNVRKEDRRDWKKLDPFEIDE